MVILMLNQWFIKGRELNHLIVCGCISVCVCAHVQVELCKCENLHASSLCERTCGCFMAHLFDHGINRC